MSAVALLRSATFRRGVAAALIAWAPGSLALILQHREVVQARLAAGAERLESFEEEIVEIVHEFRLEEGEHEDALGEPLTIEEVDGESFATFLARYLQRIRQEIEYRDGAVSSLMWRLALLGEIDDAVLVAAPVEDLLDLILEETPEALHDPLLGFTAERVEDYEDTYETGDLAEITTADLLAVLADEPELVAENEACLRLFGTRSALLASSFDQVLARQRLGAEATVLQVLARDPEEESDAVTERWCLVEEKALHEGGRLLIGCRFDDDWAFLRRSRLRRDLVLLGGLPLALLLGWSQTRSFVRFLNTLRTVADRQARGDVGARLQAASIDSDLAAAARAVNATLDHLERTVRALSQVGDSIAHDLRTPLARLQGQLDLLRRHPDPSRELIDAVQAEADQILETFNALLRIAQVESGQRKQGFRRFDLAATVGDVAELYAPVFAEKDITFTWRSPEERVEAFGDRDLWMQALSNLVENALKYTPEGGRVEMTLAQRGAKRRIFLRDSGPGIPESERENVFRRFYRLERHRGARGNGLGLSLVAAICELHEAKITLGHEGGLTVEIVF